MTAEKKAETKPTSKVLPMIGFWAFVVALVLGVIGGIIAPEQGSLILILVILGIIVGLLNITEKEVMPLLIAAIALIVVSTAGFAPLDKIIPSLGSSLDHIVKYFATFMAPAAVINAIKVMFAVARPG